MTEKVLLVEDETILRKVVAVGLRRNGFDVVEAADGDTAIEIMDDDMTYDALVTDVQMPGHANGADVANFALRTDPDVAVVIMSGDTGSIKLPFLGKRGAFIAKPFSISTLVALVVRLLRFCKSRARLRRTEVAYFGDR